MNVKKKKSRYSVKISDVVALRIYFPLLFKRLLSECPLCVGNSERGWIHQDGAAPDFEALWCHERE